MSKTLRFALVAEGPTDGIVIEAALRAMLGERPFVLIQLQPEGSIAFGGMGGGWGGVYRWCKQSARRGGGSLAMDRLVLEGFDLLIVHVDADVARSDYAAATIVPRASDLPLPCERPCPPAIDTTDELRAVVLSWCGEAAAPQKVVLCVPSKSIETWVVACLFPADAVVSGPAPFECFGDAAARLGQQPVRHRIRKAQRDYRDRAADLAAAWKDVARPTRLGQAYRFQRDVVDMVTAAMHGE